MIYFLFYYFIINLFLTISYIGISIEDDNLDSDDVLFIIMFGILIYMLAMIISFKDTIHVTLYDITSYIFEKQICSYILQIYIMIILGFHVYCYIFKIFIFK